MVGDALDHVQQELSSHDRGIVVGVKVSGKIRRFIEEGILSGVTRLVSATQRSRVNEFVGVQIESCGFVQSDDVCGVRKLDGSEFVGRP